MGLGKKANLILTARADHHWSSPDFDRDGPRVYFDLEGYDILFWEASKLPELRDKLARADSPTTCDRAVPRTVRAATRR